MKYAACNGCIDLRLSKSHPSSAHPFGLRPFDGSEACRERAPASRNAGRTAAGSALLSVDGRWLRD